MSTVEMAPLAAGDLEAVVSLDGQVLRVRLAGNADLRSAASLTEWLRRVRQEASRLGVGEAVVDLRRVEFMSSSCLQGVVAWIGELQTIDATRQYRLRFLSDPRMLWQRRSLDALSRFAIDLVTVETVA